MYLLWRVLTGRHTKITLSFLIAGHTKFSCDWCFGLLKRKLKRTRVDSLGDMEDVVKDSARGNIAQLCENERGEVFVPTYDWKAYLPSFFKKVVGIKKFHHFIFSKESQGNVILKEASDSEEVIQNFCWFNLLQISSLLLCSPQDSVRSENGTCTMRSESLLLQKSKA